MKFAPMDPAALDKYAPNDKDGAETSSLLYDIRDQLALILNELRIVRAVQLSLPDPLEAEQFHKGNGK